MKREELYGSDTAKVVLVGEPKDSVCCVTFFTYASKEDTLKNVEGFGESILSKLGIPALHFINKKNHWWQIDDLESCLEAGRKALQPSKIRIGYGSSMGAYGILRFSNELNLDETLAFSPQFSINRKIVPWEKRWKHQADILNFESESMNLSALTNHNIVFDPRSVDALHVEMIKQENPQAHITLHQIAAGDHFLIREVQRSGLLSDLIASMKSGTVDYSILKKHANYLSDQTPEKSP